MDPRVEDPHVHELPVGHLPHGAPANLVEPIGREGRQLGEALGGHVDELGEHLGSGHRASLRHPRLIGGTDRVGDVLGQRSHGRRLRLPEEAALDPDQMRNVVTHRPAGADGGGVPFPRLEVVAEGGDRAPDLTQPVDDGCVGVRSHLGIVGRDAPRTPGYPTFSLFVRATVLPFPPWARCAGEEGGETRRM